LYLHMWRIRLSFKSRRLVTALTLIGLVLIILLGR
jgi:hypothetical protein